ncbi:MAG TPA: SAM-dependent chlorinase/fluorinase [bacterium]|nr:SAM-dependent chlorinase/fluorinase [bacterium]
MPSRSGIITLTTDFGTRDPFVGMMKGVILGIFPEARIVDLTHEIPPHDVAAAAWALKDAARFFPPGAVHVAVVDPGVGSKRRGLALSAQGHLFVGPDNGIFSAFFPPELTVELNRPELFLPQVSSTFHGRDVFAPIAARLAMGFPLTEMGTQARDLVAINLPEPVRKGDTILGQVVSVDRFGNLVTNIPASMVPPGKSITVHVCNTEATGLSLCYSDAAENRVMALAGSHGRIEIALKNGSAAQALAANVGAEVEIKIK